MALNPRQVISDTTVTWDSCTTFVLAGTIVDVAPGSALEAAYGAANLTTMSGQQAANVSNGSAAVGGTGQ
jgi:hypothetical protein